MSTATLTLEKPSFEEIQQTSKVRELIKQLPFISKCKCPESLSARFTFLYDVELDGDTPFDCTYEDLQNLGNRLAMINPCNYSPEKMDIAEIGFARLVIVEAGSNQRKGKITPYQLQKVIDKYSNIAQKTCLEVDRFLTFEEALLSWWWQ